MSQSHHILILGGGAIGLCCAYYLRREGHGVTMLESGRVGQRCSLHNAGLVVPSHIIPLASPGIIGQGLRWMLKRESPFYLKPRLSPSLLRWAWLFHRSANHATAQRSAGVLLKLFAAGSRLFEELSGLDDMDFGLQRRGILMLYRTERGKAACEHEAQMAQSMGLNCQLLDREALADLQPAGAIRFCRRSLLSGRRTPFTLPLCRSTQKPCAP